MTSNSTVTYDLSADMKLSSKLLRIANSIICGLAFHWHYLTHHLPLKLYFGHDSICICKGHLIMQTDIDVGCITGYSASIVDLRGDLGSSVSPNSPWNP